MALPARESLGISEHEEVYVKVFSKTREISAIVQKSDLLRRACGGVGRRDAPPGGQFGLGSQSFPLLDGDGGVVPDALKTARWHWVLILGKLTSRKDRMGVVG
jgi:hypothetical protein